MTRAAACELRRTKGHLRMLDRAVSAHLDSVRKEIARLLIPEDGHGIERACRALQQAQSVGRIYGLGLKPRTRKQAA